MTKTLTEQWREGTLPEDTYYVRFICGRYGVYDFEQFKGFGFDNDLAYIEEILAPVPSYDEYCLLTKKAERADYLDEKLKYYTPEECLIIKGLEKRLAIATKALKDCYNDMKYWAVLTHRNQRILSVIKKALKEMEGVK